VRLAPRALNDRDATCPIPSDEDAAVGKPAAMSRIYAPARNPD